MNLKETVKLVDKKYIGNPTIILQGRVMVFSGALATVICFANSQNYEIEDDSIPFEFYPDGKTLVFRVK